MLPAEAHDNILEPGGEKQAPKCIPKHKAHPYQIEIRIEPSQRDIVIKSKHQHSTLIGFLASTKFSFKYCIAAWFSVFFIILAMNTIIFFSYFRSDLRTRAHTISKMVMGFFSGFLFTGNSVAMFMEVSAHKRPTPELAYKGIAVIAINFAASVLTVYLSSIAANLSSSDRFLNHLALVRGA